MTWADYLAWWQDPVNLWRVTLCGAMYLAGQARGRALERRKHHYQLMDQLDVIKRLVRMLLNPRESEK